MILFRRIGVSLFLFGGLAFMGLSFASMAEGQGKKDAGAKKELGLKPAPTPPRKPNGGVASIQIAFVVFNPGLPQQSDQFIPIRAATMMILLVRDVFLDRDSGGGTHRKRGISLLPLKMLFRHHCRDPSRGGFLELPPEVRQTVRRL